MPWLNRTCSRVGIRSTSHVASKSTYESPTPRHPLLKNDVHKHRKSVSLPYMTNRESRIAIGCVAFFVQPGILMTKGDRQSTSGQTRILPDIAASFAMEFANSYIPTARAAMRLMPGATAMKRARSRAWYGRRVRKSGGRWAGRSRTVLRLGGRGVCSSLTWFD